MTVVLLDRVARAAMERADAIKSAEIAADRAFVRVVREERERASIGDIAERAGMSRGNVHRLLRMYPENEREETR